MSFIKTTGEKKLMLFSGRAHPELAEAVAEELGIELTPTTAYDFANGEIFVRYKESVRGCDAFVIQSHPFPLNKWLMEQFIMTDALKRASAKRITVVTPFYGYARQDKKHRGREPISARLMADFFKAAGADRLMAVDLHTAQIQGFFDGPVDHLFALPLLASHVNRRVDRKNVAVVSPDSGRLRLAERWSETLGGAPFSRADHCSATLIRPASGDTTASCWSPYFSWTYLLRIGSAIRWSTGPSKKPWICEVCRSTQISRFAPAVLNRSAISRAEIGSRPRCFLSCRAYP